jgi:hypothetical protein
MYDAAARRVAPVDWRSPVGVSKWSPAEITEHLNLTYDVLLAQLRGGEGLRVRTGPVVRRAMATIALRMILLSRRIPTGARAPSEIRPEYIADSRAEALTRFERLAGDLDRQVAERYGDPSARLTHHLFGELDLVRGVDFVAIHLDHHRRQLPEPP